MTRLALSLTPPATVQKIVSEILPASGGVAFAKDARDLLIECCVEFITLISSEANEISEKEAKKTIACDHITKALEQLGFSDYVPAVMEAAAEHKDAQKVVTTPSPFLFLIPVLTLSRAVRRKPTSSLTAACRWKSSLVCRRSSSLRRGSDTVELWLLLMSTCLFGIARRFRGKARGPAADVQSGS